MACIFINSSSKYSIELLLLHLVYASYGFVTYFCQFYFAKYLEPIQISEDSQLDSDFIFDIPL